MVKGLGCGCCGNDSCGLGHDTGFYEDDFSSRDPGWTKFNQSDQTIWESNWTWTGSTLKADFPTTGLNLSNFNHFARRKSSVYVKDRVQPRPFTLYDISVDVTLYRPPLGYRNGPVGNFSDTGAGYWRTGGIASTSKFTPESINESRGFLDNRECAISLGWDSGFKATGSDQGPRETVGIAVAYNYSWNVQTSQIEMVTSRPFAHRPISTAIDKTDILIHNDFSGITDPNLYPESSITKRLRLVRGFESSFRTVKAYYDGEHLLTLRSPYTTASSQNDAEYQWWCNFSNVLGFRGGVINRSANSSYYATTPDAVLCEYDNYEQTLFT